MDGQCELETWESYHLRDFLLSLCPNNWNFECEPAQSSPLNWDINYSVDSSLLGMEIKMFMLKWKIERNKISLKMKRVLFIYLFLHCVFVSVWLDTRPIQNPVETAARALFCVPISLPPHALHSLESLELIRFANVIMRFFFVRDNALRGKIKEKYKSKAAELIIALFVYTYVSCSDWLVSVSILILYCALRNWCWKLITEYW